MASEEFACALQGEQLIRQREGEALDFKQDMPRSSDLARLVTAFYNTQGGIIVFGAGGRCSPEDGYATPHWGDQPTGH